MWDAFHLKGVSHDCENVGLLQGKFFNELLAFWWNFVNKISIYVQSSSTRCITLKMERLISNCVGLRPQPFVLYKKVNLVNPFHSRTPQKCQSIKIFCNLPQEIAILHNFK